MDLYRLEGWKMKRNSRLTECDEQGNWALKGVKWNLLNIGATLTKEVSEKLYGALFKLKEYEDTGLSPEQIAEMDELYAEKCRELAEMERRNELSAVHMDASHKR